MKKILTALMLLALVALPIFAETTSDLMVTTSVAKVSEYGFVSGTSYSGAATSSLTGLIGNAVQTIGADASDFSVVVRTNSNEAVNVKLYSTELQLKNGQNVVDSIPLYLNGAVHSSTDQIDLIKNTAAGTGMRIEQASFKVSYDADAYAAATVGDYTATITMVVTGN